MSRYSGPTHLNAFDNLEKEVVIPGGLEAPATDAQALGLLLTQKIEREMTQDGKVLSGMALADAALILVEGDIQHPMDLILDPPMAPSRLPERFGGQVGAEQVVPALAAALVAEAPFGFDHANRLQARPLMLLLQPRQHVGIGDHPTPSDFDPSVALVHAPILVDNHVLDGLRLGVRKHPDHVGVEGFLILLECQDVVSPLLDNLSGDLALAAHRVDCDNAASDGQYAQEFRDSGDLVGFVVDLDLGQDETIGARPRRDHMDRGFPVGTVAGTAHRFAIDGDDLGGRTWATACIQATKHAWNCLGSRAAKTRLNVSWDGMPLGRSRKDSSHVCFASPNAGISSQLSAPQITAHKAMTTMETNGWSLVRSTRGSSNAAKCSIRDRLREGSVKGVLLISVSSP